MELPRRNCLSLTLSAIATLAVYGCAVSEPFDSPDAALSGAAGGILGGAAGAGQISGAAGTSGAAGVQGTGAGGAGSDGTTGAAGTTGITGLAGTTGAAGTAGLGGRGGSNGTGRGGNGASGRGGAGGTTGAGGKGGSGGSSSTDAGAAPTFTDIYNSILIVYCSGNNCHNPGSQNGVGFSTQATAYSSVKSLVTPGNGAGSSFYKTVNTGAMPLGAAKLSAASLALIKAWIDAGALDN
jgi:hypothetical protein